MTLSGGFVVLDGAINLSILDFKSFIEFSISSRSSPINLSILDFKLYSGWDSTVLLNL